MLTVNELFSGVGAQAKALERLGIEHKILATSDVDKDAIVSYAAIHCGLTLEMVDNYSEYPTNEEMIKELADKNIGLEFKNGEMKPYNWNRLIKCKDDTLKKYWLAQKISNQIGDISGVEQLPQADMWTYSFPCTDLSVAGKMQGMTEDTRSGLLWQVQRLLETAVHTHTQPKYLQLENVKNLVGKQFLPDFNKWLNKLEELGYNNYWQVMNAKDYGVPQNRERVFCISILKEIDKGYEFPKPFPLEIRLKDILEKEVDEKYYLSAEALKDFSVINFEGGEREC